MVIVWDEWKRISNLEKHGMDFASLTETFFAEAMIVSAKEGRSIAVGRMNDGTVAVVFATLGTEAFSVISMRPASRSERELFE